MKLYTLYLIGLLNFMVVKMILINTYKLSKIIFLDSKDDVMRNENPRLPLSYTCLHCNAVDNLIDHELSEAHSAQCYG